MYIVKRTFIKNGETIITYGRSYYSKYGSCISMTKDLCKATLFDTVDEATSFINAYLNKCSTIKVEEMYLFECDIVLGNEIDYEVYNAN